MLTFLCHSIRRYCAYSIFIQYMYNSSTQNCLNYGLYLKVDMWFDFSKYDTSHKIQHFVHPDCYTRLFMFSFDILVLDMDNYLQYLKC